VSLLSLAACGDDPAFPTDNGPIQVSVVAATTGIVQSGQEIPVTVTVLKSGGKPYPNFLLNFNVLEGGGRMFGGAALTNSKGVAKDIWTIGFGSCQRNTIAVRAVDGTTGMGTTYFTQTVATPGKISFYRRSDNGYAVIYVMNVDGSNLTKLDSIQGGIGATTEWSPDGRRIVFDADGGTHFMNEDGSNETIVSGGGGHAWSNDGNWLAYSRTQAGGLYDIAIMSLDGSIRMNMTHTPESGEGNPDWSPDDNLIAFSSDRDGIVGTPGAPGDIYVTDGTTETRLTFFASTGGTATNPAWSPDGSKIAFDATGANGKTEIYVMNADGTEQFNLTNSVSGETWPDWSPDGGRSLPAHPRRWRRSHWVITRMAEPVNC
jgi:dipeptidyl aminopeptidase/acylaminoacyl peptidase